MDKEYVNGGRADHQLKLDYYGTLECAQTNIV